MSRARFAPGFRPTVIERERVEALLEVAGIDHVRIVRQANGNVSATWHSAGGQTLVTVMSSAIEAVELLVSGVRR